MSTEIIDNSVLEKRLKSKGFRLTGSRKTIFSIVINIKTELSAEEIFILARKKDPKIGIATIYRTIGLLEEFNLIEKVQSSDNKVRYRLSNRYLTDNKSLSSIKKNQKYKNSTKSINRSKIPGMSSPFADSGLFLTAGVPENTGYSDFSEINRIQAQLDKWSMELNKIKSEKEIKLEEIINDFGRIDKVIERYDNTRNNLIQMLLDIQDEYNWLPKHALLYVGNRLSIPLTQIYSIASFYKFFNLEPKGKYSIIVCAGTACHVRGSMNLLQRIVNILNIKPGDTTADYKFTLDTVNCLGCCALGPVMFFNNKYYSNPSSKELKKLFNTS